MPTDLDRAASMALAAAVTIAACGGSSSGPTPTELRVAGTYDTAVTIQQNACTGITVQRFITTVTHTPGATTLTLTHAGNAYTGTVQRNGTFSTTPKAVGGASETHTLTIAGTFTATYANGISNSQKLKSPSHVGVHVSPAPLNAWDNTIPYAYSTNPMAITLFGLARAG